MQGFHNDEEDDSGEPIEIVTPGIYYYNNGHHYLVFEEATEGFTEKTRSIFKFSDHRLMVHRKGLINSEMLFETDKRIISSYETPLGRMKIGISATCVSVEEEEDKIFCGVDYSMSINDSCPSDCHIEFSVEPRQEWSFGNRP